METSNNLAARNRLAAPSKAMWTVLIVSFCLFWIHYCYADFILIIRHSITLLECTLQGKLFSFYSMATPQAVMNGVLKAEVPYDIWVYIPFAIWNLPLYLFEQATGVQFDTIPWLVLWAKMIMVIPLLVSVCVIRDIVMDMTDNRGAAAWAQFFFLSSAYLMNGLVVLSQIDIFSICFSLLGVRALFRKKTRQFLLYFSIATTFKLFALFIFIPIILLNEKRISTWFKDTLCALAFTITSKLVFFQDKMNTPTQFDEIRLSAMLFQNRLPLGSSQLLLFVLAFLFLLAWCYRQNLDQNRDKRYLTIYVSFLAFAIFYLFTNAYPYWIVLMAPWSAILLVMQKKSSILPLISALAGISYMVAAFFIYSRCYSSYLNVDFMLSSLLFDSSQFMYFCDTSPSSVIYKIFGFLPCHELATTLFVFFILLFSYITLRQAPPAAIEGGADAQPYQADRRVVWTSLILTLCVASMPWICYCFNGIVCMLQ